MHTKIPGNIHSQSVKKRFALHLTKVEIAKGKDDNRLDGPQASLCGEIGSFQLTQTGVVPYPC